MVKDSVPSTSRPKHEENSLSHQHAAAKSVKVAILAGGTGSRLAPATNDKPKAMITIGGRPILWHIMMHYAHLGFADFVIALGHKGDVIRDWVENCGHDAAPQPRTGDGAPHAAHALAAHWTVQAVDTGLHTESGGRVKRLGPLLQDATFMLTYCDGLSDINLRELLAFHRAHGRLATVTAVHPPSRFGHMTLEGDQVIRFAEKPTLSNTWISGAYFVLEPPVLDYVEGDGSKWEKEPLERLARDRQLMAYRHDSFWQCMDTPRERELLESLWRSGQAPWKVWR